MLSPYFLHTWKILQTLSDIQLLPHLIILIRCMQITPTDSALLLLYGIYLVTWINLPGPLKTNLLRYNAALWNGCSGTLKWVLSERSWKFCFLPVQMFYKNEDVLFSVELFILPSKAWTAAEKQNIFMFWTKPQIQMRLTLFHFYSPPCWKKNIHNNFLTTQKKKLNPPLSQKMFDWSKTFS